LAAAGSAELAYLEAGTLAALRGELAGLATAPFSKALADEASGFPYPGQTEYLAAACARLHPRGEASAEPVMLMAGPRLRVALATTHLALADVPAAVRGGAVARTLAVLARALEDDFGLDGPRVGVCALNPHAGEQGRFGREDDEAVRPQVAEVRARLEREGRRVPIEGPLPADTLFASALQPRADDATRRRYDAVLALYHDQGLGPAKLLDFDRTVNVTLGLPIVRTAPDHGVAYDLAGTGRARPQAMAEALALAAGLAGARRARQLTPDRGQG
jgi:4-hydroxythreonine-4-phosphate dehydrogenase